MVTDWSSTNSSNPQGDQCLAGTDGKSTYLTLSGTSQAAAVASGAAALLLQANPNLTPGQAKLLLQLSAQYIPHYALIEEGAGSINVPLAIQLAKGKIPSLAKTLALSDKIGGETVNPSGLAISTQSVVVKTLEKLNSIAPPGSHKGNGAGSGQLHRPALLGKTLIWGSIDTLIWGDTLDLG